VSIRNIRRANRKGFTLIELLVVVLILSILMAVALPLYLSAVADSQKKTCRANLQTIANAVQAAHVKNTIADAGLYTNYYGAVTAGPAGLEPDLNSVPICPNGGAYTVEDVTGDATAGSLYDVKCSIAAHGTFEPGVDSH